MSDISDTIIHAIIENNNISNPNSTQHIISDIHIKQNTYCYEYYQCCKRISWTIKQSVSYFIIYIFLIVLNAFILVWELSGYGNRRLCIILEGFITVLFICEIIVQLITIDNCMQYWTSCANICDIIVCLMCIVFYLYSLSSHVPHTHYNISDYMDVIIIGIRYTLQTIRLLRYATKGNENRHILKSAENIEFNQQSTLRILYQHGIDIGGKRLNNVQKRMKRMYHQLSNGQQRIRNRNRSIVDDKNDVIELVPIMKHNHSEDNSLLMRNDDDGNRVEMQSTSDESSQLLVDQRSDHWCYDSDLSTVYRNITNEVIVDDDTTS